ncbi:hypothetical protein QE152_g16998 [Popillia japonica]|uniref:DDE Tnp4 domain-containing protein n=1 Tax=Popillia japonica TaxID=7064 RepID=A0AAW1L5I7_POPJA
MRSAISVGERLAVTLRFLASGDSYRSLSYLFRIPRQTISEIIPECCEAIYKLLKRDYMEVPSSEECWNQISEDFKNKWNCPNAIGALDGKHVVIVAPPHSGKTPQRDNMSNESKEIREEFKEYFVSSEGEVSWQYRYY